MDIVVDYMSQIVMNKKCQLHCVSFEFNNHIVNVRRRIEGQQKIMLIIYWAQQKHPNKNVFVIFK